MVKYDESLKPHEGDCCCSDCCKSRQAFQILRLAFIIVPIIAGLDKFFNYLTVWEQYLSAPFNVFGNPSTTMMVVGIIEIIAGLGVLLKPKIFSYVVALWMLFIIINLLVLGNYYDIALRDLGLLLAALALGRLSCRYDLCKTGVCSSGVCSSGVCKSDETVGHNKVDPKHNYK